MHQVRALSFLGFVGAFLLASSVPSLANAQARLWSREFGKQYTLTTIPSGDVLLSNGDETMLLNGKTGETIWSREDLRNCRQQGAFPFSCSYSRSSFTIPLPSVMVPNVPMRMVSHSPANQRLVLLDLSNGKTLFDVDDPKIGDVPGYTFSQSSNQFAMFLGEDDKSTVAALGMDGQIVWRVNSPITKDPEWVAALDDGLVLLFGKNADDKRTLAAFNSKSGQLAWELSSFAEGDVKIPRVVRGAENSLIAFLTKDGPMRIDRSGKVTWRSNALKGEELSEMTLAEKVLFVRHEKKIVALGADDGRVLWQQEARFDPTFMKVHAGGVLVWSRERLDLLDMATGSPRWKRAVSLPEFLGAAYETSDKQAYVAGKNRLVVVDLATGAVTELASYQFGDGEAPTTLTLSDNSVILESSQNFGRYDLGTRKLAHRYYKAPRTTGWKRLGAFASDVMTPGYGLATKFEAALDARFGLTVSKQRYLYFYFENESGGEARRFGYARVDKTTGEEAGTMWLNARNPTLAYDDSTGAFFAHHEGSVEAYQFVD